MEKTAFYTSYNKNVKHVILKMVLQMLVLYTHDFKDIYKRNWEKKTPKL